MIIVVNTSLQNLCFQTVPNGYRYLENENLTLASSQKHMKCGIFNSALKQIQQRKLNKALSPATHQ